MEKYDPLAQEPEILDFWKKNKVYHLAKQKSKGKKKFYFLDGPPYTSGKVHLGTAWNKSLKDSIQRYKRMQGFDVWDRAGYDMHGLPTENAAEKELGIESKEQIKKYGVGKFVSACKDLSIRNLKIMNEDFIRLGVWMDFENAYQSVKKMFIDGEWFLVKKAHQSGRLYEGLRSMAWDWKDQTALAKHELEYKDVTDKSIYVKFKIMGKIDEYLIIWTTTPWTIAFNLGVMVNPEIEYARCRVGDETWIVAKDLADTVILSHSKKEYEIISTCKGSKLEGTGYIPPFYDELKQHYDKIKDFHPRAHTVVLSKDYVDTISGSGLVHMAPGCGPEDYEVGRKNDIPAWNLVDESGIYEKEMGKFSGRHAIKDNQSFTEDLDKKGSIAASETVQHQYPHGQRSHEPIIFRTTKQWFFKIEDIKNEMIQENNKIKWVPKAGYNAFNSWLENLRDNSISKQRYWGTPIPIWRNENDSEDYLVIGSIQELEQLSGKKIEEPHIPWIDEILIKIDGKTYRRIPDVLDVWVDAGTVSWNCLDFPSDKETFNRYFPVDFILEGKDQIRGWFNLLHIASMLSMNKRCFDAVYMHGFINDAMGRKMSKSLGNYILPEEVVSKYGADTLRYYTTTGANAGLDLNYNFEDMKVKYRNLSVLWNIHNYLIDLTRFSEINPKDLAIRTDRFSVEERYLFSLMNSVIRKVTKLYDNYRLDEAPLAVEEFFLKLSRTYIQLTREKSQGKDRKVVIYSIYNCLITVLKLFSPTAPFITEIIYQNLKKEYSLDEKSIHLNDWPKFNDSQIDLELEKNMDISGEVLQAILSLREKLQMGIRWPLQEAIIVTKDPKTVEALELLKDIVKSQSNIKEIDILESLPGVKENIKPDYSKIGPDFGKNAPAIIAKLATESPKAVLESINKKGRYELNLGKDKINIIRDHLLVQREVPGKYLEAAFKNGFVYLNRDVNEDLEAEGFARELTRRVQDLRKNSGLQKKDQIILYIKLEEDMEKTLKKFQSQIETKVGADKLKISYLDPSRKHNFVSDVVIRDHKFKLFLDKVE
jgi:isoleucyl-tRNA synthetase